jgi:hypothetical protein
MSVCLKKCAIKIGQKSMKMFVKKAPAIVYGAGAATIPT